MDPWDHSLEESSSQAMLNCVLAIDVLVLMKQHAQMFEKFIGLTALEARTPYMSLAL